MGGHWRLSIQLALIFNSAACIESFVSVAQAQLANPPAISTIAPVDPNNLPPYTIRVIRDGTEVEVAGGFRLGLTADFAKVLKTHRNIKVVHLDSMGGHLAEGSQFFRLVKTNRLITYVSAKCASACTLAFAGGTERYLRRGAVLGFHRGAIQGSNDQTIDPFQRKVFVEAGFDRAFIDKALGTAHKDMWVPDVQILLKAQVITASVDDTKFAASGFGKLSRDEFFKTIGNTAIHNALRSKLPQQYREATNEIYDGVIEGRSQAELAEIFKAKVSVMADGLIPFAADETLVAFAKLTLDQYRALRTKNVADCYIYVSRGRLPNYAERMPKDLQARESALQEQAVRTAVKREALTKDQFDVLRQKIRRGILARGNTPAQVSILGAKDLMPDRYDEYCGMWIKLYEEITGLPTHEAARAMEALLRKL